MGNSLALPIYASKSKRKVPETTAVAVTMYRSGDNSVREYALFTADGEISLGTVHYHPKRKWQPAHYTMESVSRIESEKWSTLTEFAIEMGKRLEVEVQA